MNDQENILQTVKTAIQDFMAPDVRELKVRAEAQRDQVASMERRMDDRFKAVDDKFASLEQRIDDRFKAVDDRFASLERSMENQTRVILAAIAQSKAENESFILRHIGGLTERVAALEATRH